MTALGLFAQWHGRFRCRSRATCAPSTISPALMPPIRDAKRFVVETSKHIIDNISMFEECSSVQEEAHIMSHKAKKDYAHIQTDKRAAAGHADQLAGRLLQHART